MTCAVVQAGTPAVEARKRTIETLSLGRPMGSGWSQEVPEREHVPPAGTAIAAAPAPDAAGGRVPRPPAARRRRAGVVVVVAGMVVVRMVVVRVVVVDVVVVDVVVGGRGHRRRGSGRVRRSRAERGRHNREARNPTPARRRSVPYLPGLRGNAHEPHTISACPASSCTKAARSRRSISSSGIRNRLSTRSTVCLARGPRRGVRPAGAEQAGSDDRRDADDARPADCRCGSHRRCRRHARSGTGAGPARSRAAAERSSTARSRSGTTSSSTPRTTASRRASARSGPTHCSTSSGSLGRAGDKPDFFSGRAIQQRRDDRPRAHARPAACSSSTSRRPASTRRRGIFVWDRLRELRDSDVTLVLTTHDMDEAALLADRVGIMDHGRSAGARHAGRADATRSRARGRSSSRPIGRPTERSSMRWRRWTGSTASRRCTAPRRTERPGHRRSPTRSRSACAST